MSRNTRCTYYAYNTKKHLLLLTQAKSINKEKQTLMVIRKHRRLGLKREPLPEKACAYANTTSRETKKLRSSLPFQSCACVPPSALPRGLQRARFLSLHFLIIHRLFLISLCSCLRASRPVTPIRVARAITSAAPVSPPGFLHLSNKLQVDDQDHLCARSLDRAAPKPHRTGHLSLPPPPHSLFHPKALRPENASLLAFDT